MSFIQKTIRALWVKTHPLTKMVRALPALLRRNFPREADVWTASEIRETYKKHKFHEGYINYALSMILDEQTFNDEFVDLIRPNYKGLRLEVARKYLDGDDSFTFTDLKEIQRWWLSEHNPVGCIGGRYG